jgi:hypothetical protein
LVFPIYFFAFESEFDFSSFFRSFTIDF